MSDYFGKVGSSLTDRFMVPLFLGFLLWSGPSAIFGEELQGANKIIEAISLVASPPANASPTSALEAEKLALSKGVDRFVASASTLTSQEAADQWLSIFDRFFGKTPMAAGGLDGRC